MFMVNIGVFFFCFRCPSSLIPRLSPLFELDPLFRRTFLLVVPINKFGKISSSGVFKPVEVYTTLAKSLSEKKDLHKEEVNFINYHNIVGASRNDGRM